MNYNEMKQAVQLLANEWNLGKKEAQANGNICAWIYLLECLEESEAVVKYKDGKRLIGFCGYSKNNSRKHLIKKSIYRFIKNRLYKSKKIKNLEGLKQYEINYAYTPSMLQNYFDGEISILIVDSYYRGKGIGKKLLLDTFHLAKSDNMKNLQILTDESCNYKFYESLGCQKIFETKIKNKEPDKIRKQDIEKAFIYEKRLDRD